MAYRIYKNLHRDCFSVQSYIKGQGWRVTDHATTLRASGVQFRVYESGRRRVLEHKRKNVHAFVIAESYEILTPSDRSGDRVSYNPYHSGEFVRVSSGEPVHAADQVDMDDGKIYITW